MDILRTVQRQLLNSALIIEGVVSFIPEVSRTNDLRTKLSSLASRAVDLSHESHNMTVKALNEAVIDLKISLPNADDLLVLGVRERKAVTTTIGVIVDQLS